MCFCVGQCKFWLAKLQYTALMHMERGPSLEQPAHAQRLSPLARLASVVLRTLVFRRCAALGGCG